MKSERDLTGIFFRVARDGKWLSVDIADMDTEEIKSVLQGKDVNWLINLATSLTSVINRIADEFQIPEQADREAIFGEVTKEEIQDDISIFNRLLELSNKFPTRKIQEELEFRSLLVRFFSINQKIRELKKNGLECCCK